MSIPVFFLLSPWQELATSHLTMNPLTMGTRSSNAVCPMHPAQSQVERDVPRCLLNYWSFRPASFGRGGNGCWERKQGRERKKSTFLQYLQTSRHLSIWHLSLLFPPSTPGNRLPCPTDLLVSAGTHVYLGENKMHGSPQSKESDHSTDECLKPHADPEWQQRCSGRTLGRHQVLLKFRSGLPYRPRYKIPKAKTPKGRKPKLGKHNCALPPSPWRPTGRLKFMSRGTQMQK